MTIHVCDETRDAKRDFTCRQDLLLSQMGYFRDITTGQSLEDVDISVHCDVTIFEWLMAWLRYFDLRCLLTKCGALGDTFAQATNENIEHWPIVITRVFLLRQSKVENENCNNIIPVQKT